MRYRLPDAYTTGTRAGLELAAGPEELDPPAFRLHPLKGDQKGHFAVRVNGNWRITFRFAGEKPEVSIRLEMLW